MHSLLRLCIQLADKGCTNRRQFITPVIEQGQDFHFGSIEQFHC